MLRDKSLLIISILFSFVLACFVEHRVFFDPTAISDDVRNQVYWMARLVDPTLYPQDFIASYFAQPSLISPVVSALYDLAANWIDPIRFSQILPIILVTISTLFLFRATEHHAGKLYAFWITFAFNLYVWTISGLAGGLPRAFFYPLFFLFLWLLVEKRWRWIAICFCLQCLIYPVTFFLSVGLLLAELYLDRKKYVIEKSTLFYITLAIICSSLILAFRYLGSFSSNFGHLTNLKGALAMPEFYADGRVNIFPLPYHFLNKEIFSKFVNEFSIFSESFYITLSVIVFSIFILFVISYKKGFKSMHSLFVVPRYIWTLSVVSVILYLLSLICLFYLYMPQRYIQYTLRLIIVFFVGNVLYQITSSLREKKYFMWIFILISLFSASILWEDDLIHTYRKDKEVYNYLRNTPKNSIVAAPIKLSDNIPVFSHRSVLVSYEANIPFHKKYYQEIKIRLGDWNKAYYSKKLTLLKEFVKKYGIDYIVIDKKDFNIQNSSCLLSNIPRACADLQAGRYTILSSKKIMNDRCFN